MIIIFNPLKELQGDPQSFYRRKDNKNVHQPLCIDYPIVTSSIHTARHTSCVLISEHSIRQDKTSKGKDSIHHNKSREGENIISSIYVNKARDTSRSSHLKNKRER